MDDSTSRQWLMDCVNEGWIKFDTEKDENRFIHLVRDIAPSADIDLSGFSDRLWKTAYERGKAEAVLHGKWVHGQGFAGNYFDCLVCDQCKKESMAKTNYCPNCGARMDGE